MQDSDDNFNAKTIAKHAALNHIVEKLKPSESKVPNA